MSQAPEILTVGHSTHPVDRFIALLNGAGVEAIADVRRHPGSRRHPQFGAAALAEALREAGIDYQPFGDRLGGRRSRKDSEQASRAGRVPDNSAWQNASFRAYADYMATDEFEAGIVELEALAARSRTAIMCAEAHPSRCHRRLIADLLLARGWRPLHLLADREPAAHELTPHAQRSGSRVAYPGTPQLEI